LSVVEHEYEAGLSVSTANVAEYFKRAYELAKMSINMQASDDTLDNILFLGADAAVRIGIRPKELIDTMLKKGFSTAHHIEGSYLYDVARDFKAAAKEVELALRSKNFRLRNVRLLARIYLRDGRSDKALDALELLQESCLNRDTAE